ncbi:hypothetical protein [Pleomorphomonas oryzae]|uniref:hypothetical protein n=1 Tax=Pleomorphomonas oryzae TaxID=261934 RepID=UPI00040B41B0|nr:hypothetical protein [Pleomorphomonas oryzae]
MSELLNELLSDAEQWASLAEKAEKLPAHAFDQSMVHDYLVALMQAHVRLLSQLAQVVEDIDA